MFLSFMRCIISLVLSESLAFFYCETYAGGVFMKEPLLVPMELFL